MHPPSLHYRVLTPAPAEDHGPLADEALLTLAAEGPTACLWQAPQGLVVPRTYAARPGFTQAQAALASQGWPTHVRQSGGGVVPQGPGILNVSLAQPFRGRPLDHADALYQHLCQLLQTGLEAFGIATTTQAVEGSFCDGRYNLAIASPTRKVAGTAQVWRRLPGHGSEVQVGLVHALILAQCDPVDLTQRANQLESLLGSARRYRAERIASLDQSLAPPDRDGFATALAHSLQTRLQDWSALPW